jgi:hypothetical protein
VNGLALNPYAGNGRDPYNTATTDRRHVVRLAERIMERRRLAKLFVTVATSPEFIQAAKESINAAFGKLIRNRG